MSSSTEFILLIVAAIMALAISLGSVYVIAYLVTKGVLAALGSCS